MKEFKFKINGAEYKCAVEEIEAGKTNVTVNGKVYTVETETPAKPTACPSLTSTLITEPGSGLLTCTPPATGAAAGFGASAFGAAGCGAGAG